MSEQDYLRLLLESHYIATTLGGLQREEQICLNLAAKRDIRASAKLPKVRADLNALASIVIVQSNLINSKLQKDYEFKFQSFKVEDFDTQEEQVQKREDGVQGSTLRQQEGGRTTQHSWTCQGKRQ